MDTVDTTQLGVPVFPQQFFAKPKHKLSYSYFSPFQSHLEIVHVFRFYLSSWVTRSFDVKKRLPCLVLTVHWFLCGLVWLLYKRELHCIVRRYVHQWSCLFSLSGWLFLCLLLRVLIVARISLWNKELQDEVESNIASFMRPRCM